MSQRCSQLRVTAPATTTSMPYLSTACRFGGRVAHPEVGVRRVDPGRAGQVLQARLVRLADFVDECVVYARYRRRGGASAGRDGHRQQRRRRHERVEQMQLTGKRRVQNAGRLQERPVQRLLVFVGWLGSIAADVARRRRGGGAADQPQCLRGMAYEFPVGRAQEEALQARMPGHHPHDEIRAGRRGAFQGLPRVAGSARRPVCRP